MWAELNKEDAIRMLQEILDAGFIPQQPTRSRRYDANAQKREEITAHCQQMLDLLRSEPDPISDHLIQRILDRMDLLTKVEMEREE